MKKLPPRWYSHIERLFITNKVLVLILMALFLFFGVPYLAGPERLDDALLEGIDND